jgi:hypothetical protein
MVLVIVSVYSWVVDQKGKKPGVDGQCKRREARRKRKKRTAENRLLKDRSRTRGQMEE